MTTEAIKQQNAQFLLTLWEIGERFAPHSPGPMAETVDKVQTAHTVAYLLKDDGSLGRRAPKPYDYDHDQLFADGLL